MTRKRTRTEGQYIVSGHARRRSWAKSPKRFVYFQ
jgi:hypothetical protein